MKPSKCDACGKRMRPVHHELHLTDPMTGQVIGRYHAGIAWGDCQFHATKYLVVGAVVQAAVVHPDRCGAEMEHCDAGFQVVA
jgi:hypothetical protein